MEGFSLSSVLEKKQHLKSYKGKKKIEYDVLQGIPFRFFPRFYCIQGYDNYHLN